MNKIEDQNKLIAEFMRGEFTIESDVLGWAVDKSKPMTTYEAVKLPLETLPSTYKHGKIMLPYVFYHTSWDCLMPVVEKIEEDERYNIDILQYGTIISSNTKERGYLEIVNNVADISFDRKIEHTYKAVVEFIKQYNETK